MPTVQAKLSSEDGQGLVEYALIILLVAVAVIAGLTGFGVDLGGVFTKILTDLPF
jgi:pilus assembly protein Flp/PilA